MSWAMNDDGSRKRGQPVTGQDLEERINMYISAMDKATTVNDESMSAQLQRDIQHLVDLMEKVASGQAVMDTEVPPPLVMTPIHDAVANPLGELSSRLSDYHKALYFAEEELSENRLEKIQNLQKGLQVIHSLQKRAQAGFPIKEDEIPSPVTIPDDSEFDNDAFNTITVRLNQYKTALSFCEKSTGEDRRRIPKLQSAIRRLNFLLTRAQVKRPVWRKDIPPEFDYFYQEGSEKKTKAENVTKLTLQARALQHRVSKCTDPKLQETKDSINEGLEKLILKWTESKVVSVEDSTNLSAFTVMLDNLEGTTDPKAVSPSPDTPEQGAESNNVQDVKTMSDLQLIDSRIKEYKTAALKAKRENNVNQAIKDLKVVKGLQPMRDALGKGDKVDMTLVPPPPREATSVRELPPSFTSVADSTTNSAAEIAPQSAHAQVSPFNIRPATETAEDKLARKLTSFLEDEGERKSFASVSSSSPSSLESDLSPINRPDLSSEKMDTLNEDEKELITNVNESTLPACDVEVLNPNGISTHSKPVSSHFEDNPSANYVSLPEQIVENSDVDQPSCGVQGDTDKTVSSSIGETKLDDKAKGNADVPLRAEIEHVEERIEESRNGAEKNEEESEIKTDLEATHKTNVEKSKDNFSSPTKVTGSKNPLDKIGFLACQDVPLLAKEKEVSNLSQSASNVDKMSSSSTQNCETSINIKNDYQEQTQNEKDSCMSLASELDLANGKNEESSIASSPALERVDSTPSTNSLAQEINLSTNNTDLESKESNSPAQASQDHSLLPGSSSLSPMPYSVNNQITNDILRENSNENELPFISNAQKSDDTPVPPTSDVRDFYSLSADTINFDDSSDMQEFQDLMESMSIGNESSSITTGEVTDAQNLDKAASLTPNAYLSNAALYNSSPAIQDSASYVSQNVKHVSTNLNLATSNPPPESLLKSSTATQFNVQPTSTTSYQQPESLINNTSSLLCTISNQQSPQLTGLETLKYDLLLAESKTSQSSKKVVEKIQGQMNMIKDHLKRGGRKDWEEYKICLEKELQALNDGVRDYGERQEWDTYKYLNNKRMLNEKELCYLKQRIGEIKE